ncbi:hypothetical protein [Streptomyces sp. NRRL S-1022]|uniref:hypothetical protein n=1 Tax=Streptomyces sp. NRRL S-1022 TaxID=1463880 RepID=UPI001F3FCAEE|nr:hypothetical protein [Streptomyces sp. NRRL S-1022]
MITSHRKGTPARSPRPGAGPPPWDRPRGPAGCGCAPSNPRCPGVFAVAFFAQPLHWRDRERVARTVLGTLEPGGALVHLADRKTGARTIAGPPCPAVPYAGIVGLVTRYPGPVPRAGRDLSPNGTPGGEAAVFGPHRESFEADPRRLLAGTSPPGRFAERPPGTAVFVRCRRLP